MLEFDYETESRLMYVPDGYIEDVGEVRRRFFEWLYERPENMTEAPNGGLGCAYGAEDFLCYVNDVMLKDANERAWFVRNGDVRLADRRLRF